MFVITFFSKRRHDLELPSIECLWVEISIKNKIQLIGTFYRPPNSTNAILTSIEDSIGLAFETNISNILITGDFNLDIMKDNSSRKVRDLCQQFNFGQIINSVGAKLRYMGYFAGLLHPLEEKLGYYFQLGTCLGALETHVLLSFLWSVFCKWPVINVTLLTLKIVVYKIQD